MAALFILIAVAFVVSFGVIGYVMQKFRISLLPFVIAFVLGGRLETKIGQAYSVSGGKGFSVLQGLVAPLGSEDSSY